MTEMVEALHRHTPHMASQGALAELLSVAGLIALLVAVIVVVGRRRGTERYRSEHKRPPGEGGDPRRGTS